MYRLFSKYAFVVMMVLPLTVLTSCEDDEDNIVRKTPSGNGTFVDQRDGERYNWVEYAGLQWMTENYRYDINSYANCRNYIEDQDWVDYAAEQHATRNRHKYGMYYTLEGALKACPEGWRLPSDEDWRKLEIALGMSDKDAASYDWRGKIASAMVSTKDNETYINLLLGGYVTYHVYTNLRNGSIHKGAWGFYWSSSPDPNKDGTFYIYRKFAYNKKEVCRQSMEPQNQLLSVRYVRDAASNHN